MPDPQPFSIQIPHPSSSPSSRGPIPPPLLPTGPRPPLSLNSPLSPHHPVRRPPRIIQLRVHRLQPTPTSHPSTGTQHHANSQNNHRLQQSHGVCLWFHCVNSTRFRNHFSVSGPPSLRHHHPKCASKMSSCLQRNQFHQATAPFPSSFQYHSFTPLDSPLHGTPHASLTP